MAARHQPGHCRGMNVEQPGGVGRSLLPGVDKVDDLLLLTARQQQEVVRLVGSGEQTAADAARLFNVHPSTIARLQAKARLGSQA